MTCVAETVVDVVIFVGMPVVVYAKPLKTKGAGTLADVDIETVTWPPEYISGAQVACLNVSHVMNIAHWPAPHSQL